MEMIHLFGYEEEERGGGPSHGREGKAGVGGRVEIAGNVGTAGRVGVAGRVGSGKGVGVVTGSVGGALGRGSRGEGVGVGVRAAPLFGGDVAPPDVAGVGRVL